MTERRTYFQFSREREGRDLSVEKLQYQLLLHCDCPDKVYPQKDCCWLLSVISSQTLFLQEFPLSALMKECFVI